MASSTEPRKSPLFPAPGAGVVFVATALAYAVVPVLEQKARGRRDAAAVAVPDALGPRAGSGYWSRRPSSPCCRSPAWSGTACGACKKNARSDNPPAKDKAMKDEGRRMKTDHTSSFIVHPSRCDMPTARATRRGTAAPDRPSQLSGITSRRSRRSPTRSSTACCANWKAGGGSSGVGDAGQPDAARRRPPIEGFKPR